MTRPRVAEVDERGRPSTQGGTEEGDRRRTVSAPQRQRCPAAHIRPRASVRLSGSLGHPADGSLLRAEECVESSSLATALCREDFPSAPGLAAVEPRGRRQPAPGLPGRPRSRAPAGPPAVGSRLTAGGSAGPGGGRAPSPARGGAARAEKEEAAGRLPGRSLRRAARLRAQ